jgi:3-deoxy-D-manno-octulosonic-acid transferase
MSLAWAAYRTLAPVLGAIAPATEIFASPQEKQFWRERLGDVSLPGGCHAWVHASSLGETGAVAPLLRELSARQPGARYWLTASTRTGRDRLGALTWPSSLAPIDSPQAVKRFFRGIEPQRLLLIETELWPHWLLRARAEKVPVAIVSARLGERSVRRYQGLGRELRGLVGGLAAVMCQSEADAARWRDIGADPSRVTVVGNLKSDGLPEPVVDRSVERAGLGLDAGRPLLVLGSLRPGEARAMARAWMALPAELREQWQVVAVPRHPRAAAELREEAARVGVTFTAGVPRDGTWRWDERMGILVGWYRAAEVAFVGGSLTPFGGHNPLEAAACGCAVVMGQHHNTQLEYVRALRAADALALSTVGPHLLETLTAVLSDAALRERMSAAGLAVAKAQRGSAGRAVSRLSAAGIWPV